MHYQENRKFMVKNQDFGWWIDQLSQVINCWCQWYEDTYGMDFFSVLLIQQFKIGPAIGFGVTTLALCDVVYTVPEATFNTPFMKLAFCAEGCSSLLFPRIMGISKANEMLVSWWW